MLGIFANYHDATLALDNLTFYTLLAGFIPLYY